MSCDRSVYYDVTTIAFCGHASTQAWQSMHSDSFTGTALPFWISKTFTGHESAQTPSPSHLLLSTFTVGIDLSPPL
jgi:hypothetical protein